MFYGWMRCFLEHVFSNISKALNCQIIYLKHSLYHVFLAPVRSFGNIASIYQSLMQPF